MSDAPDNPVVRGETQADAETDPQQLARAFATASYLAELGGDPVVFRVGERAEELETRLPASAYGFITAWNPDANRRSVADNEDRDDALVARLDALGAGYRRTWAQDAHGGHREAGWLVAGPVPSQIDELGREFDEAGVLAWLADEPVRLHMLMSRPAHSQAADPPCTDWIE